jgi:transposase
MKKSQRITGKKRKTAASSIKARYARGASIRDIAESTGRSYGFIHKILMENGTSLRGRGGPNHTGGK